MNVALVEACPDMIPQIIARVREEQVEAVTDKTELAKDLRTQMMVSSHCYVGMADGQIAVVWGVMTPSITSGLGVVWALTTDVADQYPIVFARRSRIELEKIRQSYSDLVGYVNCEFKRSIRWLRWLGFEVGQPETLLGIRARRITMKGAL